MLTKGNNFQIQVIEMDFSQTLSGHKLTDVKEKTDNM
jgi:hypothetical protein